VLETATSEHDEVPATVLCAAVLSCDNTATEVMGVLGVDRMHESRAAPRTCGLSSPSFTFTQTREHVQAVEHAELLATRVGRAPDEGDVAVSLLDDPDSPLARALAHLGIDRERLEEALADTRSAN
jgi:hypothetical protein